MLVVWTILSWQFDLHTKYQVDVIGNIQTGLPVPNMIFSFDTLIDNWFEIAQMSFTVAAIGFLEAFSIAKSFAVKNSQNISADKEFFALGAANMISSFFTCFPSTGSFSRTAVNATFQAKSLISNLVRKQQKRNLFFRHCWKIHVF